MVNCYDYGARFYDPQIGRWNVPDPLAEVTEDITPYHYCLNNPIANIDPTGMWTETANGYSTNDPSEIAEFFQNVVGRQDPQKQDSDKKKEEEKKKKEEERKTAYEKEKKEYEEETGRTYHGLSVEDEEWIGERIMGSPLRLAKAGKIIVGATRMTQWGWKGTATWKQLVKIVKRGGAITNLLGKTPTEKEAIALIKESGGKILRTEKAGHSFPNPHTYSHINYQTPSGGRGAIKIKD